MNHSRAPLFPAWLLAVWLLVPAWHAAPAQTIFWGSAVNDLLYDSTGAALDDSFIFEICTFGSFLPDDSNKELWLSNWKVLDRASAPASNGWDSSQSFFSSSFELLADGTSSRGPATGTGFVFSQGEQAYIWAFNSQTLNIGTEWALITNKSSDGSSLDDWILPPLPDPCGCTPGSESLEWRLSTASFPDFGGLNDQYGAGNVTFNPSSFSLQTATLPEPGGFILLASACLAWRLRRSRA